MDATPGSSVSCVEQGAPSSAENKKRRDVVLHAQVDAAEAVRCAHAAEAARFGALRLGALAASRQRSALASPRPPRTAHARRTDAGSRCSLLW